MELRSTEEGVQSLLSLYESLCRARSPSSQQQRQQETATTALPALPPLSSSLLSDPERQTATATTTACNSSSSCLEPQSSTATTATPEPALSIPAWDGRDATALLQQLERLRRGVRELEPVAQKFQRRLRDKDPVSGQPRYGAQTAQRVRNLLERYRDLRGVLAIVFGEEEGPGPAVIVNGRGSQDGESPGAAATIAPAAASSSAAATATTIAHSIRLLAERQAAEEQQRQEAERLRHEAAEEARRAALEEARRAAEEAAAAQARREQEAAQALARQAAEARTAAERAQQEAAAADRAWVESVPHRKTLQGVKEQLDIFLEAAAAASSGSSSRIDAITALHTMFSQIVAHPEEANFRRIRRDHPRFLSDIGQYAGGKELLIAAGFELGFVEEVPSFVCKEPNIETDMDGWATWFDLLKGTLQLIEKEMIK